MSAFCETKTDYFVQHRELMVTVRTRDIKSSSNMVGNTAMSTSKLLTKQNLVPVNIHYVTYHDTNGNIDMKNSTRHN